MAEYRAVHTKMWREDEWFQELDTDAKLLWIYLFSNPSAPVAGIYRLPIRTMASECGLARDRVAEILDGFQTAGKIDYQDGVLWVHKMREYQLPGTLSSKVLTRITKDLAEIPYGTVKNKYMAHYGYPIDTVSIPSLNNTILDTDTDTDKIPDTVSDTVSAGVVVDADAAVLNTAWENSGQIINKTVADELMRLSGEHSTQWVVDAIRIAAKGGNVKVTYIEGILRNWKANGRDAPALARTNGSKGYGHGSYQPQAKRHNPPATPEDMAEYDGPSSITPAR